MKKKITINPGFYPDKKNISGNEKIVGNAWSVSVVDGKYFFSYLSGELEGKIKRVEIDKNDYEMALRGDISLDKICIKYGVS